MVLGVDLLAGQLERGWFARLARLLVADAQFGEQRFLSRARLVLHVHVGVERDERAVLEFAQRIDLRQRHVVLKEQAREAGQDRCQAVERRAGHAQRGDYLLGLPVRERPRRRKVAARDVVRMLLGDLLDVDAAHVGEQHHRPLAQAIPHHAGVVLVPDGGA